MKFSLILYALQWALRFSAWRHPAFKTRVKEKDLTVQIRVADNSLGRTFTFRRGRVTSKTGGRADVDVDISVKTAALGADLMMPPIDHLKRIEAIKS